MSDAPKVKVNWPFVKDFADSTVASEHDADCPCVNCQPGNAPTCRACKFEAELGTQEIPHPIDPRVHTCVDWEDADDEWSAEINAAHPTRSGSHEEYATAMRMVGHRHSKGELVSLVTWLLVQLASLRTANAALRADGRRVEY